MSAFTDAYQNLGFAQAVASAPGISQNNYVKPPTAAPTAPSFLGDVGNSAVNFAKSAVSGIGNAFAEAPTDLGKVIGTTIGSYQNTAYANKQLDNLNQQMSSLNKLRNTIPTQLYQQKLKNLSSQYQNVRDLLNSDQVGKITPHQVVGDVAGTVGDITAAGKLVKAGETATAAEKALGAANASRGVVPSLAIAPVKNALVNQPIAQQATQTGSDVAHGNLPGLAKDAALVAAPIAATKGLPLLANATQKLLFSTKGELDKIPFRDGTISGFIDNLTKQGSTEEAQHYTDVARQLQQHLADEGKSASFIQRYYSTANPTKDQSVREFLNQTDNHIQADAHFQKLAQAGKITDPAVTPDNVHLVGAGKFDQQDRADLISRLNSAKSIDERNNIISTDIRNGETYTRNPNVLKAVQKAATEEDPQAMAQGINDINASRSLKLAGKTKTIQMSPEQATIDKAMGGNGKQTLPGLTTADRAGVKNAAEGGYIPILKGEGAASYRPVDATDALERGHQAPLGFVGDKITKAGLSPTATDSGAVFAQVDKNFKANLAGSSYPDDAATLGRKLDAIAAENNASDPRILTVSQIKNGLGADYSRDDAKAIRSAYAKAHAQLPASLVGAGPAALNKFMAKTPLEGQYLRAEAIGRYGKLNLPFTAKRLIKGAFAVGAQEGTSGLSKSVSGMNRETEQALEKAGLFNKAGRAGSGTGDTTGVVSTRDNSKGEQINRAEKRLIGGLAQSFAAKQGKTVSQIMEEGGPAKDELMHSADLVVGYGKGGYINSPLAKTLNMAIFPSRFDTKILQLAGHAFAKMPPAAQVAISKDLVDAHNYLSSPAGQQWQKDNSELLGIIKYLTPVGTIDGVDKFLTRGGHIGDLGEVGGLPFGLITQVLQHQGVDLGKVEDSQYVDPKTGQLVPDKIPVGTTARIKTGLTDLVNSLFSYPGKTAGLSSKNSVTTTILPPLKLSASETKQVNRDGSPVQSSTTAVSQKSSPPVQASSLKIPALNSNLTAISQPSVKVKKAKLPKIKSVPAALQINN